MGRFFEFLFKNPIVLFVIGAWLVGMIGNIVKARGKERERQSRPQPVPQRRPEQPPVAAQSAGGATAARPGGPHEMEGPAGPRTAGRQSVPPQVPARQPTQQTAEDVAREMRRILGLEPEPAPQAPPPPPPRPAQVPALTRKRNLPQTSMPSTQSRKLQLHEQSNVGEQLREHHLQKNKFDRPRAGLSSIGSLGGRRQQLMGHRTEVRSRYSFDDLKRAIVLSEILSPPLALRSFDQRRPH